MTAYKNGFTMIEMMVVIAVIGILAIMAVPNFTDKLIREQIVEALPLADIAKKPLDAAWTTTQSFPSDNAAAGLPVADKIVNNFISAVNVQDGAIHITFGNRANRLLKGKQLSIRAAVVEDAPIVPVAWVCGYAEVPGKMTPRGDNRTDIPMGYLPLKCRSLSK